MKIFFRKSGEGKPLFILHGLFGMSDNWMSLSKKYAEAGFCTYLPDARNHGQSFHTDEFNYEAMAEDILNLLDAEDLDDASIIGHSMGAKTAMFFAALHPEKVSKLIIADMAPRYYPPSHQKVIAAINSIDLNSISSRKEAEEKLKQSLDESTLQFILKSLYWKETIDGKRLAWRFNIKAIEENLDALGQELPPDYIYEGPTLFLRGERSTYITDADKDSIKYYFPNSTIETVPNAGHWIHADNPEGFLKATLSFLH
jgi:pimeloyl-ACP methyl ester carboxylesterase